MINAKYNRKINKSNLIIISDNDCEKEKDSIEMFRYNEIPYFLKLEIQRKETEMQFCYDITSKRSLAQMMEYKSIDYGMLRSILNTFDQACAQTEDFMMTENDILLNTEFVFVDHNLQNVYYCYLPGNQEDICKQFKQFMEYVLQHLNHKDEQALQLAYGVYQQVVEEKTALHHVLKNENLLKNIQYRAIFDKVSMNQDKENRLQLDAEQTQENEPQLYGGQAKENRPLFYGEQTQENEPQLYGGHVKENRPLFYGEQTEQNAEELYTGQIKEEITQFYTGHESAYPKQIGSQKEPEDSVQMKQLQDEKVLKRKIIKAEKNQENILAQDSETIANIKQKESIRKQAAEKLKKMLRKKIYTDKTRFPEENTVFEADEQEAAIPHPTVCLMPETDWIQNQFVYQGADRSRDFKCIQGKMLLGSDRKESDICIPFPMVSRIHARVVIDAQGTFLEDMNSTNGTHVNGELLQYHEKRMLQKGDIISLAGECYSFH